MSFTESAGPVPSPVDRLIHRAAPHAPGHGAYLGALGLLEGSPPGIEDLRELVAGTAPRVPALAYRIAADRRRVWEPATSRDPRRHVHELRLEPGLGALSRIAAAVLDAPFPDDAADWGVWLVTGWAPDGYALAARVHHALQDAQGAMAGLVALMSPEVRLPLTVPAEAEPPLRLWAAALWAARNLLALVPNTADWAPARATPTGTRVLHSTTVDADRLVRLTKAAQATLNQVYLAVTAGALRAWSPADWDGRRRQRSLHAFVPVETRPQGHELATLGNHLAALRVPLPCAEPDPRRRLELLRKSARADLLQGSVQRAAIRVLPVIPALVIRCLLDRRRTALLTTCVQLGGGQTVNGDPVRQAVSLPPQLFGQPLTVALTSYDSECTVVFTSDRRDPDPAALPPLWERALADLETAYGL